jgi:hypothetical protein
MKTKKSIKYIEAVNAVFTNLNSKTDKELDKLMKEVVDSEYFPLLLNIVNDNTNSTVDDRERRFDLNCSYCRPNKGDNANRKAKHGKTKPRYKNKRK